MTPKNTHYLDGIKAQTQVVWWLRSSCRLKSVVLAPPLLPYDILANGWRVEVKNAVFGKNGKWRINFHRHNVLRESEVDFYILRLEKVPTFNYAIHLVIPAPVGILGIDISLRSLLTRWGVYFNKFEPLLLPAPQKP